MMPTTASTTTTTAASTTTGRAQRGRAGREVAAVAVTADTVAKAVGSPPLDDLRNFGSVTSAQVRAADAAAEAAGLPAADLMQAAGLQVARLVWRITRGPARVTVLAGHGNNGGDGLVAARWLAAWDCHVTVAVLADPVRWRLGALLEPLRPMRDQVEVAASADSLLRITGTPDLVLDALLGTGARGDLRPEMARLAAWAGAHPCVAADLPTGVDADSGAIAPDAIRTIATCALASMKRGMWQPEVRRQAGDMWVADIGMPAHAWVAAGAEPPRAVRGGELLPVPAFTD